MDGLRMPALVWPIGVDVGYPDEVEVVVGGSRDHHYSIDMTSLEGT